MKAGRVMALYGARWVQLYAGRVEITFLKFGLIRGETVQLYAGAVDNGVTPILALCRAS